MNTQTPEQSWDSQGNPINSAQGAYQQTAGEPSPDRMFSTVGRVGVLRFNSRVLIGSILLLIGITAWDMGKYFDHEMALLVSAIPSVLIGLFGFIITLFYSIKRLHDLNLKGWFFLIALIPLVGVLWSLFVLLMPGEKSANRFGLFRKATPIEKFTGLIGIFINVLILLLPWVNGLFNVMSA